MDDLDLNIIELLSVTADLVNKASRTQATTAEAITVSKVPTGALYKAKQALQWWKYTEYSTDAIRNACQLSLE